MIHSADILVGDLAGISQLVPESLNPLLITSDFWFQELQGDLLVYLVIKDLIYSPHSSFTQLLDDLVPLIKSRPC